MKFLGRSSNATIIFGASNDPEGRPNRPLAKPSLPFYGPVRAKGGLDLAHEYRLADVRLDAERAPGGLAEVLDGLDHCGKPRGRFLQLDLPRTLRSLGVGPTLRGFLVKAQALLHQLIPLVPFSRRQLGESLVGFEQVLDNRKFAGGRLNGITTVLV